MKMPSKLPNSKCNEPSCQTRDITRSHGFPNMDTMTEGLVSTMADCFPDMEKVTYGSRVIAKLVNDVPCDNPRYSSVCQEQEAQGRVISEEECASTG